jgi:hypothetical protein
MTCPRKHPSVAFWITVALVAVLVAYPLSFGPACWGWERGWVSDRSLAIVYLPIERLFWNFPKPVRRAIIWWGNFGCASGGCAENVLFRLTGIYPRE